MISRSARNSAILVLVVLLLVLVACNRREDTNNTLVYTSEIEGNQDVYIASLGSEPIRLTADLADDHSPSLSPDGKWVAFVSERNGNADVFIVRDTGKGLTAIIESEEEEASPVWSANGDMLAYLSRFADGTSHIFVTEVDDPNPQRLTNEETDEGPPLISPDGQWIAFTVLDSTGASQGIKLRNLGGVNQVQLTNGPDTHPTWSPDGHSIAFESTRDGDSDIYVVDLGEDLAPGEPRRLTNDPAADYSPAWSPKGEWIAFISERDGNPEVYIISIDGTLEERLTLNEAKESSIAWSKGGRLAFVSDLHGNSDIFVMDSDGTHQQQVTIGPENDSQPDW